MMDTATVLVQAGNPAGIETDRLIDGIGDALLEVGIREAVLVRTVGPYDAIVRLEAATDLVARAAVAIQGLDGVACTLTLPHVSPPNEEIRR